MGQMISREDRVKLAASIAAHGVEHPPANAPKKYAGLRVKYAYDIIEAAEEEYRKRYEEAD